jgi:hypothetical protein
MKRLTRCRRMAPGNRGDEHDRYVITEFGAGAPFRPASSADAPVCIAIQIPRISGTSQALHRLYFSPSAPLSL